MKKKESRPCPHFDPDGTCRLIGLHLKQGETVPCLYPEFKMRGGRSSRQSPLISGSCPIILMDKALDAHYPPHLTGVALQHRLAMIVALSGDDIMIGDGHTLKLDR